MFNAAHVFPAGPGGQVSSSSTFDAVFPPDFDAWPSVARWLFKEIVLLPSWKSASWASPSDEYLRERRACRSTRTIRRMRALIIERQELEYRRVRRGDLLPNGERARATFWVYLPGAAMRRRLEALAKPASEAPLAGSASAAGSPAVTRPVLRRPAWSSRRPGQIVRRWRKERPQVADNFAPDRSSDQRSEICSEPTTPAPSREAAPTTERTSLHSEEETKAVHVAAPLAPLATTVLAYYAIAIGARWKTVHPELVALVVPLLDGMTGDNDSKLLRMRAIIDRVVTEARRLGRRTPTPRYIFNPPFFWRRLDRLRDERGRLDGASPPLPAPCRPRNAGASGVGEHAPSLANGRTDAELAASGWSAEEITELRAIELDARSRHGLLTKRAAENEYKTRRH